MWNSKKDKKSQTQGNKVEWCLSEVGGTEEGARTDQRLQTPSYKMNNF
jgi:hypothetical protein